MTEILIFSQALITNMVPSSVEAVHPTKGVGCGCGNHRVHISLCAADHRRQD